MASNSDIKRTLGLINNINQTANLELKLQSLAKIKVNLTNNESLKAFKQLCGFKILCGLLKNNSNTKVINLVLSILANSAMKPDICKEMVTEHHVLADVSSILYNVEHPSIHCRAIRLVANVAKTSAYSKYVTRFPFLSRIVSVLSNTLSSDSIITCIRAIKHLWLWDEYRIHNELIRLNAIKLCLDKLTLLNDKPSFVLTHLSIVQAMLNVNTKAFINQMSYPHYEWMVNLLCKEDGRYDPALIQILLKLSTYSKTHFELAKTCLVDQLISLMWPLNTVSPSKVQQLTKILSAVCKENLFRQKIIQSPNAIVALLTYLDVDVIQDVNEPIGDESVAVRPIREENETQDLSLNEDTMFEIDDIGSSKASTSSLKPSEKTSQLLTNAIHYNVLICINHYQYDHEGLYRFLRVNLIPILMKRLSLQIDKYEYKHSSPVCDQSKYLSTRQSLNMSGNTSPLSPGNMSPQSSSLSPLYLSPNRSPPSWHPGAATSSEVASEVGDQDEEDDDKSVYSPLIDFSDDSMSNTEDNDSNDVRQLNTYLSSQEQEERLDVHIVRIMLHISYMRYPFEQLSYKNTWNTLVDYLVKVQQDDCCRNVYKVLLTLCKKREFLRALLLDNFILVVHKKLCRMKHGSHCMICSNVMIYGQGILNEISNETNSHFGFSEIMHHYYRLLELDNRSQPNLHNDPNTSQTNQSLCENQSQPNLPNDPNASQTDRNLCENCSQPNLPNDPNASQTDQYLADESSHLNLPNDLKSNQINQNPAKDSNTLSEVLNLRQISGPLPKDENSSRDLHLESIRQEGQCSSVEAETPSRDNTVPSDLKDEPPLIHFMIPYLLKDHPLFHRILFGSDAILSRILSGLDGGYQEEAVSCVEELLSLNPNEETTKFPTLCRKKCAPPPSYEGDITFLLDDGSYQKANRDLLITRSLYFETMLCGNFKECDQKSDIKLSNITASCLSHLLKLIAHYDTCALPRNDVEVYLELIVKSDEYLLHEVNYKLIELLYAPNVIVNSANIHRVYAWSLRYNEFVQSCLSNYENFFSKNEYSPLPLGSGKRMRLTESARDETEMRAVTEVVQSGKENNLGDTEMKVDSSENEKRKDENRKESIDAQRARRSDTMDVDEILDNGANTITVIETSENNDKAMGELTLSSLRDIKRICDTSDKIDDNTCRKNDTVINVRNELDANNATKNNANKADVSLSEQPGCSYSYDEETPNSGVRKSETTADSSGLENVDRKVDSVKNDGIKIYEETNEEKGEINDDKMEESKEEEAINLDDGNIANENELIVESSWSDSTNKPADVENKSVDLTNEPVEPQPCLISDLINEIDQNNKSLLRKVPSTSSLPPLTTLQTGIDQDVDKIKAILLLKNEPSFKLRKLQTPLAGKRKLRGSCVGHSLRAGSSKSREDLNIHLIKLMFSSSRNYRKSVEIVRNIIAMSREEGVSEDNMFEQFKQDLYEIIFACLK